MTFKTVLRLAGALILACALASCAGSGGAKTGIANQIAGNKLPPPDTTAESGAYEGTTDYHLGAMDLLDISVFGVQDLDKEVRVNSNGMISLPLVGAVMAGGLTVPQLEEKLEKAYSKGFLQNPQVTVFVKEYTSQRITVEGAVDKPGIFPITGRTTLIQAIAMAGGVDEKLVDLSGIVVMRQVKGKKEAAVFDLRKVRRGEIEDPELYGDDIVVVEQSGSKTALRRFIETAPAFGAFYYYLGL